MCDLTKIDWSISKWTKLFSFACKTRLVRLFYIIWFLNKFIPGINTFKNKIPEGQSSFGVGWCIGWYVSIMDYKLLLQFDHCHWLLKTSAWKQTKMGWPRQWQPDHFVISFRITKKCIFFNSPATSGSHQSNYVLCQSGPAKSVASSQ